MRHKALTLSIVIPVYNEENYLSACLRAIANQTEAPDEVIVVDNNSRDRTVEIAKSFPFVKLIHEPKQGLYFSRNTGVAAAKGDIIGRIDADTRLDSNWVAQVRLAFTNPEFHTITGPLGYYDMPIPRVTRWGESVFLRLAMIGGYKFLFGANMAFRREAWDKVVGDLCNEPFLLEDIDMALHLIDRHMPPTYVSTMSALVSSRRLQDSPRHFWRYISGHPRTLSYHHKRAAGAYLATFVFSLSYVLIKPLHMVFDPEKRRIRIGRLWDQPAPRPDPMNVKPHE